MKKLFVIFVVLLSACTTIGTSNPPTPAQLVAQFCPVVQTLNSELTSIPGVSPNVIDVITKAKPIVNTVCASGVTITSSNLQDLLSQGLPLLLEVTKDSAIAASPQGQALMIAIPIAQVLIPQIISGLPKP